MKKYLLIFLIIICVPVSASTDYSILEHESVSSLPEASENTLNKIYDYDNKYFVTEKKYIEGNKRHFQVGDDLAKSNICIDFAGINFDTRTVFNLIPSVLSDHDISYYQNINDYIKTEFPNFKLNSFNKYNFSTSSNLGYFNFKFYITNYDFYFHLDSFFSYSVDIFNYNYSNYPYNNYDLSNSINILDENYCFYNNVSSIPNITVVSQIDESNLIYNLLYLNIDSGYSYSWKEINYSDWYRYSYSDDDLYLFYSFDDICKFNIFSNYDFTTFSDFEKLCITIIINLFFCIFLGLCIYIIIKVFNKFITILFR